MRGDFNPCRTTRDDIPIYPRHNNSNRRRLRARRCRCARTARWRSGWRFHTCRVHGKCRRSMGQRKEEHRGRQLRWQGFVCTQSNHRWRHRRRPVQGHQRPIAQHPYQADVDGKHRYGRTHCSIHVACAQETPDVYIHYQPSNHKSLAAACVK